jgi:hypothetical protein
MSTPRLDFASVDGEGPITVDEVALLTAALRGGASLRTAWERYLLDAAPERAESAMLLYREARGGWWPLVRGGPGSAVILGNALAGTAAALATVGFEVTVVDPRPHRLEFLEARMAAAGHSVRGVAPGEGPRLPFDDQTFDLVVQEGGAPTRATGWRHDGAELLRIARGEVVLVADNRLGYKRSQGARGQFQIPTPLTWIRAAARPTRGERTLVGYRELLEDSGFGRPRALALYPHADDFTHVVALDDLHPKLHIGPMERRNHLKMLADSVGLFPVLAPSFAIIVARRERGHAPQRIERLLEALAERIGERSPWTEELLATRGNCSLVQTRLLGSGDEERAGRWTLHVPLSPTQRAQCERHFSQLEALPARFPGLPMPEPLFAGELEGVWLTCERRLTGLSAPQISGRRDAVRRMLREASAHLTDLRVEPRRTVDAAGFEQLIGRRFELAARYAAQPSTQSALERLRAEARERLLGRDLPLVLVHGDLRGKHVQVTPDGAVLGYLDWGISEPVGLPAFDLLHLLVHERKQEQNLTVGAAWRGVRDPATRRAEEQQVLSDYARAIGLEPELLEALVRIYPVLVADIAERNWDYSRPRWLQRQFAL